MNYLFASTIFGAEKLLEKELIYLGAQNINIQKNGIYYEANDLLLYKTLMWSRIASRIFLCIKKFKIYNIDDLYKNIVNIHWDEIFSINSTFIVYFKETNKFIQNSLFGVQIIKDAIVDQFKKKIFSPS